MVADGADRASVERFVREHDIRYPVLLADEETVQRFRVTAFPTNYYLDKNGILQQSTVRMSTRASLSLRLWFVR